MIVALALIMAVSGTITYLFLNSSRKPKTPTYIHENYTEKPFDYKGVRPHDFIKNRVMFYPYNYVNG